MIDTGDRAPAFRLDTHDGRTIDSKDLYGKEQVVLFFYPKASTGG